MGTRGFGHLYLPTYVDRRTGDVRAQAIWWLKWSHEGIRYRESTHTRDHAKAENYRKAKFREIWSGRMPWEPRRAVELGELLDLLLKQQTAKGRRSVWRTRQSAAHLRAFPWRPHGRVRASDITEARLLDYTTHRREVAGAAAGTVNRELAALRAALRLGHRFRDEHGVPMVDRVPSFTDLWLEEADPRTGYFEEGDFRAVQALLPAHLRPLVEFMFVTGWRQGEVLRMTWARVNTTRGIIELPPSETKAKRWRDPWPYVAHPGLRALIEVQLARKRVIEALHGRIVQTVFCHDDGRPIRAWRRPWVRARQAAGLHGRLPKDFDRTAARNYILAGIDRKRAMRLMGRKTEAIFERYNIVNDADQERAVGKLADYHAAHAEDARTVEPIRPPRSAAAASSER